MSNVSWGSVDQVMRVYETLINLKQPTEHGMIPCPVGTDPTHYPPPFPIVATAEPIQRGVITEDGLLCDLYAWVSQAAWDEHTLI